MLRTPRGLNCDEIGDVFSDNTPSLHLGDDEHLVVGDPAKLGVLLHSERVNPTPTETFDDRTRIHLVEQQPHWYKRERVDAARRASSAAAALAAIRASISSGNAA